MSEKTDIIKLYLHFINLKKIYIGSIVLFSVFVFSTTFVHTAFGATAIEGCGLWDVSAECDLSGWMKLFMGDIAVGAILAIFLHILAHRSNESLKENGEQIQKILQGQETTRKARRDYAVQNLKNHLTTLLFVLGIINRLTMNYNTATDQKSVIYSKIKGEEERMARIIQNARNTTVYSSDTLDPTLVNQIDGVCTFVSGLGITEKEGKLEFAKYDKSRRKLDEITKKLSAISQSTPVFK
ncbi:MAG: hypothetical protein OEQ15_02310 [Nitrosopumilus sp.]|nr:hypothetical protein [Nitrosopumilus sp.]MDH3793458.1 hypothetical protein [Nitrosopumilus sp.]MDH3854504.1 hypothetical protein [Nitrosopumilus sp.]